MTVKELIEKLKEYPDDMIVTTDCQPNWGINLKVRTWTHDNYPYNKPSFDYLNIE